MSRDEQIFFDPGYRDFEQAAKDVARRIGGHYAEQTGVDLSIKAFGVGLLLDEIEPGAFITGAIRFNSTGADSASIPPTEREVHDHLPLIWNLMQGPRYDEVLARQGARLAFDRLVASGVGWPMMLTHDTEELVATYDVEHGVREFPPGTSTYTAERQ